MNQQNQTFEQNMLRLEQIVRAMERGDVALEESLKLFERGVELTGFCSKALEEAQQKIAILTKDREGGITAKLFSPEGETDE